ncbi:hypothetical protein N7495_001745 [Penicillium taxi]|uniref:uncharacterized protein n=1 Tax=Penicillium taxi TaxID=168475 RepID=UPI002545531F|nr:uncharacterized protein N7495_001745 [Penicillium taxi]KAJ5909063.1 hypothetical protein N7495_001745 [Penicillium taxi]
METDIVASHLAPIAPAPVRTTSVEPDSPDPTLTMMRFNCQVCVRKKIKCDKTTPVCSSCSKAKLQCIYRTPLPRKRRRLRSQLENGEDVHERLARYERILLDNNLLHSSSTSIPYGQRTEASVASTLSSTPMPSSQTATSGKLLSADGQSRYIDSVLLDMCEAAEAYNSDQDDNYQKEARGNKSTTDHLGVPVACPLSGAILGSTKTITEQHPNHGTAIKLWNIYVQNVEPLCKILHVPTVAKMVNTVSKQPSKASKSDECLIFVIYYFAVFSLSDADCLREFDQPKNDMISKYRTLVYQALINASWLSTTSIPVLQAYTLFLIVMRNQIDSDTFWILTGIAIRLAQRMGLHRDGEKLGLPPFEVQMRRRIFWQLLPLDSYAGQVSGTGIVMSSTSWDTKHPLNINDDQIFPGMIEPPIEQRSETEMIFCLSRIEFSDFYTRTGVKSRGIGEAIQFRDAEHIERLINEVEDLIETNFLRYCDILNPLHFYTIGITRSATAAVRLRARMPLLMTQATTNVQKREICALAAKILDTINAIYSNSNMRKYRWQLQAFWIWDALLCILRSIADVTFYSTSELNVSWKNVADVYANHEELFEGRTALYVTIVKLTLKAWCVNPPSQSSPEPTFITSLYALQEPKVAIEQARVIRNPTSNLAMPSLTSVTRINAASPCPVLIIGAGLSGLAAGRLLTNNGIANIVFEASSPQRDQGFAISLHDWSYSLLLEALGGLSLQGMTKAVAPDRFNGGSGWVDLAMRDNTTGEVLIAPEPSARSKVVRANRNALRTWIADCGDEELDVRYHHKLKAISGSVGNIRAIFENGAEYQGSLVISADGVHSTVYHGEFEVSRDEFDSFIKPFIGDANILAGVGDGFNTPITICHMSKSQVHLDWSYSRPARSDDDPLFCPTSKVMDQTRELPQALFDELASMKLAEPWVRYINPETIKQHSVFHWVSRCVNMTTKDMLCGAQQGIVFIGDAWHAMPIFAGEGGNHALLDSVELVAAIKSSSDLDSAILAYYDGAGRRCQDAVRRSKSRFYVLHRPMTEWQDVAAKRRLKATA